LHNGHLSISTGDGIRFYGPPEVSLTDFGDTSKTSNVAFDRYPSTGTISYKRTIAVPPGVADAIRANDAVVVVHGIDYNNNGAYDDVLGRSDLSSQFDGEATAPALCGPLHAVSGAQAAAGSGFTASLSLTRVPVPASGRLSAAERLWLLCHLPQTSPARAGRRSSDGWATTTT
jgi:hypothetical protein